MVSTAHSAAGQVRTEELSPSKAERKAAERFEPEHEPEGVWGVLQRDPWKARRPSRLPCAPSDCREAS